MMDDAGGRTRRRNTRYYSNDFAKDVGSDDEREGGEDMMADMGMAARQPVVSAAPSPVPKKPVTKQRRGNKRCPSCDELVKQSSTVCEFCDYVFTTATKQQEEVALVDKFSFEVEREEDGSLKIELILGRRRLRPGGSANLAAHGAGGTPAAAPGSGSLVGQLGTPTGSGRKVVHRHLLATKNPKREKYCYEYLVKFKGMSYLKTKWLTYHQIEAMGTRSKQALSRWLKKLEKGDSEDLEDGTFDHNYGVVEKVLDHKEVDMEETDDEEDGAADDHPSQVLQLPPPQQQPQQPQPLPALQCSPAPAQPSLYGANLGGRGRSVNPYIEGELCGPGWFPMTRCRFVFNKIAEDEYADWFYDPVDTSIYTDYLSVVPRPMCLSQVRAQLEMLNAYNGDPRLFAADMRLVWKNCEDYNPALAPVHQAGLMFSRMFERLFQAWVMTFEIEQPPWEETYARPWEYKCLVCRSGSDDSKLLMCDNCDSEYHIYCLTPPLPDVPIGLWLCPRCEALDLEGKGSSNSHASEEAFREKVARGLKERRGKRQRVYLVKWKDLGYAWCTWEKPQDLKDDRKVEEYHRLLEESPPKAVVPQAELLQALSKRNYNYAPAVRDGDEASQLELQIYAQTRTLHFLKWKMPPPASLLKDCGSLLHAYTITEGAQNGDSGSKGLHKIRQEVGAILTELVDHVAKGTWPPPPGLPQLPGEYDVLFYRVPGDSLSLNIGSYKDRIAVMGFRERDDGVMAPLARSQRVNKEDVLMAINGESVTDIPFHDVIERLKHVSGYMTMRFVKAEFRDQYLEGAPRPVYMRDLPIKRTDFPKAPVIKPDGKLPFSSAIAPAYGSNGWTAKVRLGDKVEELGRFNSKREAADAFKDAVVKDYGGESAASRFFAGLDAFVEDGAASLNSAQTTEEYYDSSDSEVDTFPWPQPSTQNSQSTDAVTAFMNMGQASKLVRAIADAGCAPEVEQWNDPFYFQDVPESDMVVSGPSKQQKWVEQLDLMNGKPLRMFESAVQASHETRIGVNLIQQALQGRDVQDSAGGYKWRYADDSAVATSKQLWEQRSHVGKGDGEFEPWKKKLPTIGKVFKDGNKLRDYQLQGVQWLLKCWYQKRSCILADEMGLGKTVQIVALLEHINTTDGLPGPFLVVVPLSTIEHWRRELESWTNMRYCMYYDVGGNRGMREVMREYEWYYRNRPGKVLKINVLVTTYEALIKDHEVIAEIPWRVIIVDEAHRLRNWRGKLHECLKLVSQTGMQAYGYQHRVLMTGTPLQNNTQELWSLLHFIEPSKFPDLDKFNERYGRVETVDQVQNLQKRLEPHLLRRTKEDVASDIPPKEETIIDVELTTLQKQYYRAIFERNHAFLYNKAGVRGVLPKLMNIQMELRKCCNHPFLIDGVEDAEMEKMDELAASRQELELLRLKRGLVASSGKMVLMDKLLPKLRREGHKVLIFSQMIRVLDLLEEFCEKRGFNAERLDGRVTGNQRQQAIDRFNTDTRSFVFLLSTRAGGVGINLTAADICIIYDSDWNPQNDVQAMARCHRIGQTKEVQVYRLITRKSFEAEMFERASRKLGLEHAVLGGHNFRDEEGDTTDRPSDKPSSKEMEQLLRQGAYALLEEEGDDDAKGFCEDDIDKIMKERAHKIVMDAGGESAGWLTKKAGFQRRAFQTVDDKTSEVDINDEDFWQKVMPDLKTPDMLERRFQAMEQEPDTESAVKTFFSDLESMVTRLIDLHKRNKCPPRDRDEAVLLLLKVSMKEDLFPAELRDKATQWRMALEGPRIRACRQDNFEASGDEEASPIKKKKNKSGTMQKDLDSHSDVCMVCAEGGSMVCCDGQCKRSFHPRCVNLEHVPEDEWVCPDCVAAQMYCLICNQVGHIGTEVVKCKKVTCGRFYHPRCIAKDERVKWFKTKDNEFFCPQHVCRDCKERGSGKVESKDKFFLACIRCPNGLHARCAMGKHVVVLTYRSMICDAHTDPTQVPPLTPDKIAHIPLPKKKAPPKPKLPKAALTSAAVLSKGRLEDSDYVYGASDFDDGMSDDSESGKKKAKANGQKKKARRPLGPPHFTSRLIGPFRSDTFHLSFIVAKDSGGGGGTGAGDDKVKKNPFCPCGRSDESEMSYIQCGQCQTWYHQQCVGITPADLNNMTEFRCPGCRSSEAGVQKGPEDLVPYSPIVRIQYKRVAPPPPMPDDDQPTGAGMELPPQPGLVPADLAAGREQAAEYEAKLMLAAAAGAAAKKKSMAGAEGVVILPKVKAEQQPVAAAHYGLAQSYQLPVPGAQAKATMKKEDLAWSGAAARPAATNLYCLCRQPEREGDVFIGCDQCLGWYHPKCVGLSDSVASSLQKWVCPPCMQRLRGGLDPAASRYVGSPDTKRTRVEPAVPTKQEVSRPPV